MLLVYIRFGADHLILDNQLLILFTGRGKGTARYIFLKYSISAIREMQIKITLKFHLLQSE